MKSVRIGAGVILVALVIVGILLFETDSDGDHTTLDRAVSATSTLFEPSVSPTVTGEPTVLPTIPVTLVVPSRTEEVQVPNLESITAGMNVSDENRFLLSQGVGLYTINVVEEWVCSGYCEDVAYFDGHFFELRTIEMEDEPTQVWLSSSNEAIGEDFDGKSCGFLYSDRLEPDTVLVANLCQPPDPENPLATSSHVLIIDGEEAYRRRGFLADEVCGSRIIMDSYDGVSARRFFVYDISSGSHADPTEIVGRYYEFDPACNPILTIPDDPYDAERAATLYTLLHKEGIREIYVPDAFEMRGYHYNGSVTYLLLSRGDDWYMLDANNDLFFKARGGEVFTGYMHIYEVGDVDVLAINDGLFGQNLNLYVRTNLEDGWVRVDLGEYDLLDILAVTQNEVIILATQSKTAYRLSIRVR